MGGWLGILIKAGVGGMGLNADSIRGCDVELGLKESNQSLGVVRETRCHL